VDATDLSDLIANQRSIYIIRWGKNARYGLGEEYFLIQASAARQNEKAYPFLALTILEQIVEVSGCKEAFYSLLARPHLFAYYQPLQAKVSLLFKK